MVLAMLLLHKPHNYLEELGMRKQFGRPLIFALLCTLPMFIGYGILSGFEVSISKNTMVRGVLCAALFEELYFRGFLFGQLFRKARLGFFPAAMTGALFFGAAHIYQGNSPLDSLGVFAITFMGAGFFAWAYVEWKYNLWIPIFLHLFMNLSWTMFTIGDNAMGGLWANIFRAITIALVIIGTIRYKRRNQIPMVITRDNLIKQSSDILPPKD